MTRISDPTLVSVIVSAWNAETTLMETLQSAAAQTHSNLEILIVDDGSSDRTAEIAETFCSLDRRARLIKTSNNGQSSARNLGIDEAKGAWLAPLDADDLWHPQKIERQLRTFAAVSRDVALVYCWYRLIDERGRVCAPPWAPVMEGRILRDLLQCNFGTGSSPLIKRSLLGELRYSLEFTPHVDIGCEDWLFQLQIAQRHEIACTRAFLLGYRQRPGSTSADEARMMRAHILMYEIILRGLSGEDRRIALRELARWRATQGLKSWRSRPIGHTAADVFKAFASAPSVAAGVAFDLGKERARTLVRPPRTAAWEQPGQLFYAASPEDSLA